MKRLLAVQLLVVSLTVLSNPATADDMPLQVSGYGTLALAVDDNDLLTAMRDISQDPGNDYANNTSWRMDSRIGLQLAYPISQRLEALSKAVLRDQVSDKPLDYLELAYLDYLVIPDVRLRLGRIGYDPFLMSNHRHLGYAYTWVRPPVEFYGWIPIYHIDGGDLSYNFKHGDVNMRLRVQVGSSLVTLPMGSMPFEFQADPIWSLSAEWERGFWRYKLGFSGIKSTREVDTLVALHQGLDDITAANVPGISAEAADLRLNTAFLNAQINYATTGLAYDDGNWFSQTELGYARTNRSIVPQSISGYVVLGRRIGDFSPFAMFAISRPDSDLKRPVHDWSAINQASLQDEVYNYVVNSSRVDQETLSLGMRWDFDPNAALKLQWDHSRIHPQGYADFSRDRPVRSRESTFNLLTLSLDFVF